MIRGAEANAAQSVLVERVAETRLNETRMGDQPPAMRLLATMLETARRRSR